MAEFIDQLVDAAVREQKNLIRMYEVTVAVMQTDYAAIYANYAAKLGIKAQQLSDIQKRQAILDQVVAKAPNA